MKNTPKSMSSMSSILAKIETKNILWCSKQCLVHGAAKDTDILQSLWWIALWQHDKVLKIALPSQCFQGPQSWPVDFAESILLMIGAIFAQLGHSFHEYSKPVMNFIGLGYGIFKHIFIKDEGH